MVVEALVLPDAARVTIRIATHAILASQQCTQMPQNGDERPFPPICVHFCVPTAAHATGAPGGYWNSVHCHSAVNVWWWNVQARVAVRSVRPGPSGSVTHTRLHAQARVAVQLTLPNGIERTESVRSGSSGSVTGTLEGEWQCSLHCHSAVNVWWWNVQARVAVPPTRGRTLKGQWQCRSGRPPGRRAPRLVPGCAPRGVIPSLTRNGPSANSGAF